MGPALLEDTGLGSSKALQNILFHRCGVSDSPPNVLMLDPFFSEQHHAWKPPPWKPREMPASNESGSPIDHPQKWIKMAQEGETRPDGAWCVPGTSSPSAGRALKFRLCQNLLNRASAGAVAVAPRSARMFRRFLTPMNHPCSVAGSIHGGHELLENV